MSKITNLDFKCSTQFETRECVEDTRGKQNKERQDDRIRGKILRTKKPRAIQFNETNSKISFKSVYEHKSTHDSQIREKTIFRTIRGR